MTRRSRRILSTVGLAIALISPMALGQHDRAGVQSISPGRLIAPPDQMRGAEVRGVHADVVIEGRVATTSLAVTLHNPTGRRIETELVIPVPDGAAVRAFGLDAIDGGEATARLLPADEARRVYREIVRKMTDPGLLEFVGLGLIRSSVFPIEPGGEQTFRVTYEHVLTGDGDRVDYELPRSGVLGGIQGEWTARLRVLPSAGVTPAAVFSPSHPLEIEPGFDGGIGVVLSAEQLREPGSLRLSVIQGETGALPMTIYTTPEAGGEGGYFMLVASANAPADRALRPREITVVMDRSGSMRGEKIEQAKSAALQIIEALRPGERFNIVDYSDNIARFSPEAVEVSPESIARARAYVGAIAAVGGTNIHDALLEALRPAPAAGTLPIVLFLTDGLATAGVTDEGGIRRAVEKTNTHARRLFTFGVGFDVNAPLLDALASGSRGASSFVTPGQDVEVEVGRVFKRLTGPVLASPSLAITPFCGTGMDPASIPRLMDVEPRTLPDLFEGDQLVVVGRYRAAGPIPLTLSGEGMHSQITLDPGSATPRHAFVARLWAQRRIAALIDEIRLSGSADSTELVDEIVRLSLEHGVLTEYTAFLSAETGVFADSGALDGEGVQRAREVARDNLERRAVASRTGRAGVSQAMNQSAAKTGYQVSAAPSYTNDRMEEVQIGGVQAVGGRAFYRRQNRWVDAQLLDRESDAPDETVEFGTEAYFDLAERLARVGRQSLMSQRGESDLLIEGRRVRVRNPG